MKALLDWLDQRTGWKHLLHESLYENVPGGSRWRYVWGSTLTFTLVVQIITGLFLWVAYNPSSQTAWESVYYIQNHMWGGWLLRGLHHYTAQAMNVLLVLHLMQVVIDGAYKAPREVNFWFGLVLLFLVLALSLTGYLLPWDQKGYWATRVATSIAAITPFCGPEIQKLIVGGAEYGHHTLSRFFALHAGFLPSLMVVLLVGHIYLFRRHGLTARQPQRKPDEPFWPDQVLKDTVACLAVLAVVLFLTLRTHGAGLAAPADPSDNYSAARPEWYFLFLFELLKYFPGEKEIIGALIIPGLIAVLVFAMPFIARWRLGHRFNVGLLIALVVAVTLLTWRSIAVDRAKPDFIAAVRQAERDAERIHVLASGPAGIPPSGALSLLREDAYTQGPKLFERNCASCHFFDGHNGVGLVLTNGPSAPDLAGFATRLWLTGLLDPERISSSNYFGGTKFANGKMAKFVKKDLANLSPEQKAQLKKLVAALSAEAQLKSQRAADTRDAADVAEGRKLLVSEQFRCTECHRFYQQGEDPTGPDLTRYGSRDWLLAFLTSPKHERFYGKRNDRMPAFGEDKVLDAQALDLIVDWLRGEWYEPEKAGVLAERGSQ